MQLLGLAPWILLCALLVAFAPKIRTSIVGWVLVLAGLAAFLVRFHHEGPYPFPGPMDLVSGFAALLVGLLLIRLPRAAPGAGVSWLARGLLGVSPIVFFLALVAYGHEAEEVVVLRTAQADGGVRETRLWIMDYQGSPWIVTGRVGPHVLDLTENPRVEIFRRGEARCWVAERHPERATIETLLEVRSEKYLAQRLALAMGVWKHFTERDDLEEIAVALRFTPCPPRRSGQRPRALGYETSKTTHPESVRNGPCASPGGRLT